MTVDNATFDVSFVMHFVGKMKRTKGGNVWSAAREENLSFHLHTLHHLLISRHREYAKFDFRNLKT